ncbi:MAG: hypothetical protein IJS37_01165 [Bacilli bacterium]|nr:hypothetical protein [Bacilli bacterium]
MSAKQKWKTFGKNTGQTFANFGRSVKTTARVVVGAEERVNENGESTLKTSWKKTGKGRSMCAGLIGVDFSPTLLSGYVLAYRIIDRKSPW